MKSQKAHHMRKRRKQPVKRSGGVHGPSKFASAPSAPRHALYLGQALNPYAYTVPARCPSDIDRNRSVSAPWFNACPR